MSLTIVLDAAVSGLRAARKGLEVTADNVANVQTEGYARRHVVQSHVAVEGEGRGVRVEEVRRSVDLFVRRELRAARSSLAGVKGLAELVTRGQRAAFGSLEGGLEGALTTLDEKLQALAAAPTREVARSALLGALEDTTRTFNRAATELQQLRGEADRRLAREVERINTLLDQIHGVNTEIARLGATPALLDQRGQLLDELAAKLPISVMEYDDGTIAIYARGGPALLESGPRTLVYQPAAVVQADTVFGAIQVYDAEDLDPATGLPRAGATGETLVGAGPTPDPTLKEGELGALLSARDGELPRLAAELDELAEALRFALNAAHNDAVAVPPPARLDGTRSDAATAWNAASRSGTAYLAVVDQASGAVVRTLAVDVTVDFATLQTSLQNGLSGLATVAVDAEGRLSLQATAGYGLALAEGTSAITATDAAGRTRTFGFSHFLGLNDLLVGEQGARDLAVRTDVATDPTRLATARLEVDPAGPSAILPGVGDGRGAAALARALDRPVAVAAVGGQPAREVALRTLVRDLVAVEADRLARLEDRVATQEAVVGDLEARRASVEGVDLDEELSRLLVYQRAYSASARLIQVTRELFDELLATVR